MDKISVILTCTQPRADQLCDSLRLNGVESKAMPALSVKNHQFVLPKGDFEAMLITSQHALVEGLPDLSIIAVGEETAKTAIEKGLSVLFYGDKDVQSLDLKCYKSLLYPCAAQPRLIPENATPITVYETVKNLEFKVPQEPSLISVFSVKAAQIISPYIQNYHQVLCLSDIIAKEFKGVQLQKLVVAKYPRYDAMVNEIITMIRGRT